MRRLFAALILLLLWTESAFADSPAVPVSWEREVGPYRLVVLVPSDPTPLPSGKQYPASGLYWADGEPEPIWTINLVTGGGHVFLTEDGQYLAQMGPWPSTGNYDELAVVFYRNGKTTKTYRVRDLVRRPALLPQSVSHYAWHDEVSFDADQRRLTVATIPGTTYVFDVTTGAIVSPGAARRMLVPVMMWTGAGLLAAGLLWVLVKRRRRA
ncbi:MAG: hypothetical protein K0R39_593 [Symbiobacteriaceae bacterium]|jgi:hypothetical protein|nr:hypothetical protein [Symbiobacteriaceae bacterium]